MKFCIIIARYNEDVNWCKQFSNVIIYNKGTEMTDDFNQILLDNVGREGHTYYKHICDNYDNLADYTIFLQGNPFDHSPNIISNLNKYIDNIDSNVDFEFLSESVYECNLYGCSHHGGLPLIEVYEKIFNLIPDEDIKNKNFKFGAGSQFIVSKNKILQRPKDFYLKIVELLNNDIGPIEGYVIERFHKLIFN